MFRSIGKIQKKSENSRKKIAFISSALITLALIFVWISVFPSRFGNSSLNDNVAVASDSSKEEKSNIASPFESIGDDLVKIFNNMEDKFNELKDKL